MYTKLCMLHTVQLNFKLYTVLIFHWTVFPDLKVPGTFFPSILMGELSMLGRKD